MAYVGSSVKIADQLLQSATRAGQLARKTSWGALKDDKVESAVNALVTAAGLYAPMIEEPLYKLGCKTTLSQASAPSTFTGTAIARTNAAFSYWGYAVGTINSSYTGSTVGGGRQFKTEFETNSNNVAFRFLNTGSHLQVYIDGQRATATEIAPNGGTADSLVYCYEINLPPAFEEDGTPKYRHFSLTGYNQAFGAAYIDTSASIRFPVGPVAKRPRAWQLGDSYTLGVGPTDPSFIDFRNVCDFFGWNGLANGISGSGWNSTAGQYPPTRILNELAKISYKPDYITLALGYNDAGSNMTTLKASMRATIANIRSTFPDAQMFGYGTATPVGGTANLLLVENALKEVYMSEGIPFISVYDVVNAGNKAIYTISDNVHPTHAGLRARARVLIEGIRNNIK